MKKKLMLAALLALVAPVVWLGSGGSGESQGNALGFGQHIAGGWLLSLDLGVDVLATVNADGAITTSGQLRPAGAWMDTRYNTTGHGFWKRTGQNQLETVILLQVQNDDGGLVFYEKVKMEATVNRQGTAMSGTGMYQLFAAGVDPLDPDSEPEFEGPFTETGRRIQ